MPMPHSKPSLHLAHVVLEALERADAPLVDLDAVAQQAHERAAAHLALGDVAARDRADARNAERLAHLGAAQRTSR